MGNAVRVFLLDDHEIVRRGVKELLEADPEVTARLQPADLAACFEPAWYLRNVDAIYRRAGLL